jgi:hypothetical protein
MGSDCSFDGRETDDSDTEDEWRVVGGIGE